jgi:DNA (cytosine-5)-methyltransferase 1
VMENVPGMMQGGHSSILYELEKEFQEAGYHVIKPTTILQAAEYGIPQARRRLFILGAREGEPLPDYPAPHVRPAGLHGRFAGDLPDGPTVWDAIGDLPDLDVFEELISSDSVELDGRTLRSMQRKASTYVRRLNGLEFDPSDLSYPRKWNERVLTSAMRTQHTQLSVQRFANTDPGETEPVSRFFRLPVDGLCNTLRAGTGSERGAYTSPRPIHPTFPRVISVREAARLHSFPDWFRLHQTKWHGFRQVGNAVPPLLGRAVATEVVRAMNLRPAKPSVAVEPRNPQLLTLGMSDAARHFGAQQAHIPKPRRRAATEV